MRFTGKCWNSVFEDNPSAVQGAYNPPKTDGAW